MSQYNNRYWLHILLFIFTFLTTASAGVAWLGRDPLDLENLVLGLPYAISLLLILGTHEFGHYIAARLHKVHTTLPFFLPMPFVGAGINFGTFGAVIRMRSMIPSRKALFDIGVAGPIAGFVVCIAVLAIGFLTLPPLEYLYAIHPEYVQSGIPTNGLHFGSPLLYIFFAKIFSSAGAFIPPMNEMYHYPLLCVGWFGLFVTAMNLIPFGQLDGGHLVYGMFGRRVHRLVGDAALVLLLIFALPATIETVGAIVESTGSNASVFADILSFFPPLWHAMSWNGWMLWFFILLFVIRNRHPRVGDDSPLDARRKIIGWLTIAIGIVSFIPVPFTIPL